MHFRCRIEEGQRQRLETLPMVMFARLFAALIELGHVHLFR